jgi:undecaprenyl-diphosphatase
MDQSWLAAAHVITNPALDWIAWTLSTMGWLGGVYWLFALVLWWRGMKSAAVQITMAMVLGGVVAEVLKHATHRLRPDTIYPQFVHLPLHNLWDAKYSFPSGHAVLAAAASVAAVLALRSRGAWVLVMLALAIAWSRIYQGMHWPTDVIAGLLIGVMSAVVSHLVVKAALRLPAFKRISQDEPVYRNRKLV